MFFDKLINKIPFFRNRRIKKIKEDLVEIKRDFSDGFFNEQYISSLHNILNSPLMDFSDALVENAVNHIELYTKSSVSASKLAIKPIINKSNLMKSTLISLEKKTCYFTKWYSNEQSILEFVDLMKQCVQASVWQSGDRDLHSHIQIDELINRLDQDFLDSLLYRLLLEDLVSIITFYLESKYDR